MMVIANCVNLLHSLIFIYINTCWFLLPKKYLQSYILLLMVILLHWYILDGKCILTIIEYKLKGKQIVDIGYDNSPYIKDLLLKIGIDVEEKFIASITYISMFVFLIIAIIRINKTEL